MKNAKVLLSVIMVIVLIVVSVEPTFAAAIPTIYDIDKTIDNNFSTAKEEYIIEDEEVKGPYNNDKKIFCNTKVEENFDDSSVLVVLKNEASLDFDNYDIPNFPEVKPKNVREITENKSERIFNEYLSKKTEYTSELKSIVVANNSLARSDTSISANDTLEAMDDRVIKDNAELIAKSEMYKGYSNFNKIIHIELNTTSKQSVLDAIAELEKNDNILVAEPNFILESCKTTNDTYYYDQWAPDNISLPSAWNVTTGSSSVKVGVIDDGINASHPDLAGNYDAVLSKSFTDTPANVSIGGHGTAVAGVIGAVGNNAKGITGVCWDVSLVSLQATSSDGETYSEDVVEAINYADDNDIKILNFSYSCQSCSYAFEASVNSYDGLLVVSAGNDYANVDTTTSNTVGRYYSLLTSYNIISVAAIDEDNTLWVDPNGGKGSNYGETSVDLAAPGGNVKTTYNNGYDDWSGTSLAAPYVAGVAALIKSKYPAITTLGIRKAILSNVDRVSTLSGKVSTGGKLNAYKAITSVPNQKFTVVYNSNGGSGAMSNTTVTYGFFKNLRSLSYTAPLYHNFAGWDACRASDNKHRYKFGSVEKWCVEGMQPSGYVKALYNNQAPIAHTSPVKNDTVTMTAQWKPYTYTIIFEKNNAGGSMSNKTCEYYKQETLPANSFARAGYTFGGWKVYKRTSGAEPVWLYQNGSTYGWYSENSQPSGYTMVTFADQATFSNLTNIDKEILYFVAQWVPISYNINYQSNGGVGSMLTTVGSTAESVQLRANIFTKEHNKFIGWHLVDSDGYWSVTSDVEWLDGNLNMDMLKLYEDGDSVVYTADYVGVELNAIAQWILLGDVDLDGEISIIDATMIQNYLVGNVILTPEQYERCDFDEDGEVSIMDALAIQMYLIS